MTCLFDWAYTFFNTTPGVALSARRETSVQPIFLDRRSKILHDNREYFTSSGFKQKSLCEIEWGFGKWSKYFLC